jgi:predicted DNA-binding protein
MSKLSLTVPAELLERLQAIAAQKEITLEEAALEAFAEYAETWEDFNRTLDHLEAGEEERTVLKAVNEK